MRILAKLINNVAKSKPGKALFNPVNAGAGAALIATISCVTKDAVNCCYYVTQSLNNDRIPEEKRKFVASLDLANGILNVITQLIIGPAAEKLTNKCFDNFIEPKYFGKEAINKLNKPAGVTFDFVKDIMSTHKTAAKIGLGVLSSLIGTQIIAKRVIVPFLATPMASYFKEKFEKNDKKNKNKQDTVEISFKNNQNTMPTNEEKISESKKLPDCFKRFK